MLSRCHAVLDAFYPGMFGARAIAETLFGDNNPSGKLPYTYYRANYTQRLSIDEYAMAKPPGRGYRYMDPDDRDILLPFGHGLRPVHLSRPPSSVVLPTGAALGVGRRQRQRQRQQRNSHSYSSSSSSSSGRAATQ